MSQVRKPSGFLKQNYDKVLVVSALVALLASAVILVLQLQDGAELVNTTRSELDAANPIKLDPIDPTALDALAESIATPFQMSADHRNLLVGELRVSSIPDGLPIPFDATVCPFTGKEQPQIIKITERDTDGDGAPDVWEQKFGFNMYDPTDGKVDADADGFTNQEEFLAGTDPVNAQDTPPPPAKLRLVRVLIDPFKLRFLGISRLADGDRYQLNLRTLEKTYFTKIGEVIEGYEVIGYDEKGAEGPVLTLQQGDKTIRLIQGRVVDEQAKTALMVFLVDGKRYRANIGENISLQGKEYKVVDILNDGVVIRDEEADKEVDIGLLSDEERQVLTGAGRTGTLP